MDNTFTPRHVEFMSSNFFRVNLYIVCTILVIVDFDFAVFGWPAAPDVQRTFPLTVGVNPELHPLMDVSTILAQRVALKLAVAFPGGHGIVDVHLEGAEKCQKMSLFKLNKLYI